MRATVLLQKANNSIIFIKGDNLMLVNKRAMTVDERIVGMLEAKTEEAGF